jgi:general stress protein 26
MKDMSLLQEVMSQFKEQNQVVLGTIDKNTPKIRPVTLVKHNEKFYFATGTLSEKVKQIQTNPNVEILLQWKEPPNNGYIRISGKSIKETNIHTILELYDRFEFFSKLWKGPDDPNLIVYRINVEYYDYMKPGEWEPIKVKTGNPN